MHQRKNDAVRKLIPWGTLCRLGYVITPSIAKLARPLYPPKSGRVLPREIRVTCDLYDGHTTMHSAAILFGPTRPEQTAWVDWAEDESETRFSLRTDCRLGGGGCVFFTRHEGSCVELFMPSQRGD